MKPLLAAVVFAASAACCPLPVHRRVLVRPEGTIHVTDAITKQPIPGATVTVRRFRLGPPPRIETNLWTLTADSSGAASTTMSSTGEWVMPLMMHGVPQWAWELCAAAPGHAPVVATWVIQRNWSDPTADGQSARAVEVTLPAGDGRACSQGVLMETYPAAATGVDRR